MSKIHKPLIKARSIIASPKSYIKSLARTVTSIFLFVCLLDKYKHIMISVGFLQVFTFWVVQNNKPVIDAMNGLIKCRKATSVSTFDFSTLYTKLPHSKLLMVLNSLIGFCFDGGDSKYITVNSYGTRWVKNIKNNVICLIKQLIKDAVVYLLSKCYFTVGLKIFCQIIGILMGSDPAPFLPTYSYIFMKVIG